MPAGKWAKSSRVVPVESGVWSTQRPIMSRNTKSPGASEPFHSTLSKPDVGFGYYRAMTSEPFTASTPTPMAPSRPMYSW